MQKIHQEMYKCVKGMEKVKLIDRHHVTRIIAPPNLKPSNCTRHLMYLFKTKDNSFTIINLELRWGLEAPSIFIQHCLSTFSHAIEVTRVLVFRYTSNAILHDAAPLLDAIVLFDATPSLSIT
jgi:hypothetical protein